MYKRYEQLKERMADLKYWIIGDFSGKQDDLLELHYSENHEDYTDVSEDDYNVDPMDSMKDGWIRVLGANGILYFGVWGYSNTTFKRIYKVLQSEKKLKNYSDDIEVVDNKDRKVYRYYGSKMQPRDNNV